MSDRRSLITFQFSSVQFFIVYTPSQRLQKQKRVDTDDLIALQTHSNIKTTTGTVEEIVFLYYATEKNITTITIRNNEAVMRKPIII
jgi:hypothetical protein